MALVYPPALWSAISTGRTADALFLIANGADVQSMNWAGTSVMHIAAEKGPNVVAKGLLEKGADVNCKTLDGYTPLHLRRPRSHRQDAT
jgi:ankyrin repeat protein